PHRSGPPADDPRPLDTAGMLIGTPGAVQLVTDARYDIQAEQETDGLEIVRRKGRTKDALIEHLGGLGARRIGFEANHLLYAYYEDLGAGLPSATLVPTRDIVENHRWHKDADELALLRQA